MNPSLAYYIEVLSYKPRRERQGGKRLFFHRGHSPMFARGISFPPGKLLPLKAARDSGKV